MTCNAKEVDFSMPIESVNGNPARVLCTDLRLADRTGIVVATTNIDPFLGLNDESICIVDKYGNNMYSAKQAIRNVEKIKSAIFGWVNVYKSDDREPYIGVTVFPSRKAAMDAGQKFGNYVSTSRIEWAE